MPASFAPIDSAICSCISRICARVWMSAVSKRPISFAISPGSNAMPRDLVAIVAHDMDRPAGDAGGNPDALESRLLSRVIAAHVASESSANVKLR